MLCHGSERLPSCRSTSPSSISTFPDIAPALFFAPGQELEKYGDCDNCTCVVEFENGSSCTIGMSRTSIHGHEAFTEIYGTEGKFVINSNPTLNRMQIMDQHGVRTEST